ncbi:hypothetical protein ACWDA3_25180 [Nonomuraea rubra]
MARLLRRLEEELYVQYSRICVHGATECPEFCDDEPEMYHATATVHSEAWDAEPPPPGPGWRLIERANITAETGVIQLGVMDGGGQDFLIGPPLFEYGLSVHVEDGGPLLRWSFRFWPIRDVFDPLVHLRPKELAGSAPPPEPRRVPVPVSTAGQWAAMRGEGDARRTAATRGLLDPIARMFNVTQEDPVSLALNPDRAPTFLIPSRPLHEELDLRDKEAGGSYRMWRWERETADGEPPDGHLMTGRVVHVRDVHGRRVLASGIVTMLGMEDGHYRVRDAEPHEAARVLCSEETWPG